MKFIHISFIHLHFLSKIHGLRRLDHGILASFRAWIATSAETWLRQRLAQGDSGDGAASAAACDTVGWLLREAPHGWEKHG